MSEPTRGPASVPTNGPGSNPATGPPSDPKNAPWWKGHRGEWLVVAQIVLMALLFFGPRTMGAGPARGFPFPHACRVIGAVLMLAGGTMLVAGIVGPRSGLTPLPYPKDKADLIQTGAFAIVRHPMYSGGLILAIGWTLIVRGWLTLCDTIALFLLIEVK